MSGEPSADTPGDSPRTVDVFLEGLESGNLRGAIGDPIAAARGVGLFLIG